MSVKPLLIIINGMPATGKTTLSKRLAKDLGLPLLGKDAIKEFLYDNVGTGDLKWTQDLGAGVSDMLLAFIDSWIGSGRSMIAESAYYHRFAAPRFRALSERSEAHIIEVYCKTDSQVRRDRYMARGQSGEQHAGHIYLEYAAIPETEEEVTAKYAPLGVGSIIEVDTTLFEAIDHKAIVKQIRDFISE